MADSNTKKQVSLIFTYGTLKRGFPNHSLMEELIAQNDAEFVGDHVTLTPHPLVCGPHGIPYLLAIPGSGRRVRGELYSVSARGLTRLDDLERLANAHYERLPVRVAAADSACVSAEAYFGHRSYGEAMWERCRRKGLEEYSPAEAARYVKRRDRPLQGVSFLDDIRAFLVSSGGD